MRRVESFVCRIGVHHCAYVSDVVTGGMEPADHDRGLIAAVKGPTSLAGSIGSANPFDDPPEPAKPSPGDCPPPWSLRKLFPRPQIFRLWLFSRTWISSLTAAAPGLSAIAGQDTMPSMPI